MAAVTGPAAPRPRVLFVASEATPLIKTGGLADVAGALPAALGEAGWDLRLLLPAYRPVLAAGGFRPAGRLRLPGLPGEVGILAGALPEAGVPVWLVDYPPAFDRDGHPYLDAGGEPWPDNAERFALLCRAAVAVAGDRAGLGWRADLVHCHDWQTALVPALLDRPGPATVFTIHNLAYQGVFPGERFWQLGLPPGLWSPEGLEYYGQVSFIKGGLQFAHWLTTVSPTYAKEIQTPEFGCGLDPLLRHRAGRLRGILNGIDTLTWDPARDPHLAAPYSAADLSGKAACRPALLKEMGLPERPGSLLIGCIGRLVEQKGIDLILDALPELLSGPVQMVLLGSGEARFEQALQQAAAERPDRLAVRIGYDEGLAHRIEAGADCFLMPSRFEPCGLNQMYSQRYGTPPIVRRTGGLADTVSDATSLNLRRGTATGFTFGPATPAALLGAVDRALRVFRNTAEWRRLVQTAMTQDHSWTQRAQRYTALYEDALAANQKKPS